MNCLCKLPELHTAQTGCGTHLIRSETCHKICKLFKPSGVFVDVIAIEPAARDEDVRQPIEQDEIGLRLNSVMLRRGHGSLRFPRIDHDDLRMILILANTLPHDWMRDAKIRADEDEYVGFLEILVGVRRGIETERLFVSRGGGRHALTCVAVSVNYPHAELRQRAEKRQFLSADLAGTEPRNCIVAIFILDGFEAKREDLERRVPVDRFELAIRIAKVGCRCAVRRPKRCERLPAFRASHPEVDGVIGGRTQVYRLAVFKMNS